MQLNLSSFVIFAKLRFGYALGTASNINPSSYRKFQLLNWSPIEIKN